MGKDSATGNQVQKVALTEPAGGTYITPALDSSLQSILTAAQGPIPTQAATVSIGAVGIVQTNNGVAVVSQPTHTPSSSSSQAANTAIAASIPATAGQYSYLSGFIIAGLGATGAGVVACNITNILASSGSNTWNFSINIPAGATVPFNSGMLYKYDFIPPLQAKAIATGIQVNVGAFGAGNTQQTVSVWGYTSPSAQYVI
jgi:hypothetical protein